MDQEQSIALWKKGKEAWNEWAEDVLAQRKMLEENGEWSVELEDSGELKGLNAATIIWIKEANVDFSKLPFPFVTKLDEKVFYESKESTSNNNVTDFEDFIFPNDADFRFCKFSVDVDFRSANFDGYTNFGSTNFDGNANFGTTKFNSNANFSIVTFGGYANFISTKFGSIANFGSTMFGGYTNFISTKFGSITYFSRTHFEKPVSFEKAEFAKGANFSAITSVKSFLLGQAKFTQVPDFTESSFHAPPVLDDMEIKEPLDQGWWTSRKTDARKFRALGKMATEANDNQNAMEFFANEVRAKRGFQDKVFGKGSGRFWWGLLYDFTSNFGRSFIRPFVLWWATTLAFAVFYAFISKVDLFGEALYIAIRQGLVFSGLSRSDRWDSAIAALYGGEIPNFASYMMLVQPIISAVWIFLFFLAMRKHFKIS